MNNINVELVEWTCVTCGCISAMPVEINNKLRKSHETFFCINGHGQNYRKTEKEKTIEDLEGKLLSEYAKNAQLESQLKEYTNRITDLEKGVLNKILDYLKK